MKDLNRLYTEAKDNVKFLTTLERQFRNLASTEGLTIIEETLPSLMNGLRLVWIISRHFKEEEQMPNLLNTISSNSFIQIYTSHKIINFLNQLCILCFLI